MLTSLPLLHTGSSHPSGWLHSNWRLEPTVIAGTLALAVLYLWRTGAKNRTRDGKRIQPVSGGQRASFLCGCLLLAVALNPPLDDWADHFLISAHMVQHLLLMFGV